MAEPPVGGRFLQRWLTHPLQAAGLALMLALFRLLPIDWASGLGALIGRAIGPYLSASRVARHNLARAFPEKPSEEIERIVRAMWDNLGRVAAEYPHLRALRAGIGERARRGRESIWLWRTSL